MTCPICIESFNKSIHKKVQCLYCSYDVCLKCIKNYLLTSTLSPTCMNCRTSWNKEFIRQIMPQSFLNTEYKSYRENMLLSLEESLLPETQTYASFEKELMKDMLVLNELDRRIRRLRHEYYLKSIEYRNKKYRGCGQIKEKRSFVMSCPSNNCRGFLSNHYKCEQCSNQFCSKCHQRKMDNHECKKEDIDTVILLNSNTKKCPKCFISIFKIDGCNQMWCTECHTAFDWNTGRIINGVIHNPHFFEWQRTRNIQPNRNPLDLTCGGIPHVRSFNFLKSDEHRIITNICQLLTHIQQTIIIPFQNNTNEYFEINKDIRVKYLNNEITKDYMKWIIQKRDKANEKQKSIIQIHIMFLHTMTQLLQNLVINKDFEISLCEMFELRDYVNKEFQRVKKLFSSTTSLSINDNWKIV